MMQRVRILWKMRCSEYVKIDDPRLSMLPEKFFEGKFVLDIGCNIGLPTIAIGMLACTCLRLTLGP